MQNREIKFRLVNKIYQNELKKRKFTNRYTFTNRQNGSEYLLIIVVGYQPYYWEKVFQKVNTAIKKSNYKIDVCVSNPGGEKSVRLEKYCENYKWSYLYLKDDRLSQAQNQAIKLHPKAEYIYKIDEDIILPEFYFNGMRDAFVDSQKAFGRTMGFLAPLININGYGYDVFLNSMNLKEEFERQYGPQCFSEHFMKDPIHYNSELAVWIWKHSIPFDDIANQISKINGGKRGLCSFRFSVGAVLFSRSFWRQIGYFDVKQIGAMGLEEEQMNAYCMNNFRSIVIAEDVFVGHLGFGSQKEAVRIFFENNHKMI